jgi:LmbE family N-acetylglucosaminyl deacetylase
VSPPLLVVSPHLDDAVLSAGGLLAAHPGSVVATVLTASRPPGTAPTDWDRAGGLGRPGIDPPTVRRAEDRAALQAVRATPYWLDVLEEQYGGTVEVQTVADLLADVLEAHSASAIVMPLGLWHHEHQVVHLACRRLLGLDATRSWFAYADVPYRRLDGGRHLEARLLELRQQGLRLVPQAAPRDHLAKKLLALGYYRSQLRALGGPGKPGWRDALEPEQWWRLERATGAAA